MAWPLAGGGAGLEMVGIMEWQSQFPPSCHEIAVESASFEH
jgi:hypothetical protein